MDVLKRIKSFFSSNNGMGSRQKVWIIDGSYQIHPAYICHVQVALECQGKDIEYLSIEDINDICITEKEAVDRVVSELRVRAKSLEDRGDGL